MFTEDSTYSRRFQVSNLGMGNCVRRSFIRVRGYPRAAVALVAATIHLSIWPPRVIGCECAPTPPACVAYVETPIIVLGTVESTSDGLIHMRVDRAYKGVSEKTLIFWDSHMCDGPSAEVGEQYLMYTGEDGSGYLPWRGCTRSRNAKDAEEDLIFLNGLASAPPTGTVLGDVMVRTGSIASKGEPATGVMVEILGEGEKLTTIADSKGHYSFSGLKPGSYVVNAIQPGFSKSESESDDPVDVEARSCAILDLVLRKNWHGNIGGHVIQSDGTPAPAGIPLDLIQVEGDGRDQEQELLIGSTVHTDDHGEYSFQGVAPGSYKIVLNLYNVPTPQDPYLTMYWPGARTEKGASAVEIIGSVASQQRDFRLPPALKSTPVKVIVLLPDGTPAKEAHANVGTRMDGIFQWAGQTITDASGQFSFDAMEGFEYTVRDIITAEAVMASEVHLSAADGWHRLIINLVSKDR